MRRAIAISAMLHFLVLGSAQFGWHHELAGLALWSWEFLLALFLALLAFLLWLLFGTAAIALSGSTALVLLVAGALAALTALQTAPASPQSDPVPPASAAVTAPLKPQAQAQPQPPQAQPAAPREFALRFETEPPRQTATAPAMESAPPSPVTVSLAVRIPPSEAPAPRDHAPSHGDAMDKPRPTDAQQPPAAKPRPAAALPPTAVLSSKGDEERDNAAQKTEQGVARMRQPAFLMPTLPNPSAGRAGASSQRAALTPDAAMTSATDDALDTLLEALPRLVAFRAVPAAATADTDHGAAGARPASADLQARMTRLAAQGYAQAKFALAESILSSTASPDRIPQALALLEPAPIGGHLPSQLALAVLAAEDGNVPEAAAWLAIAARRGDHNATEARARLLAAAQVKAVSDALRRETALLRSLWRLSPETAGGDTQRDIEERLRAAATLGDTEEVEQLIANNVDVETADEDGRTPLIEAAWRGYGRIATKLLQAGAQLDKSDKSGNTPMAWAAINGHANLIVTLIKAGASVDAADAQGFTPLMRAAWNGHSASVNALLAAGAQPKQANRLGKTAIDYARMSGNAAILRLLQTT